jgi:hypothetical protein
VPYNRSDLCWEHCFGNFTLLRTQYSFVLHVITTPVIQEIMLLSPTQFTTDSSVPYIKSRKVFKIKYFEWLCHLLIYTCNTTRLWVSGRPHDGRSSWTHLTVPLYTWYELGFIHPHTKHGSNWI